MGVHSRDDVSAAPLSNAAFTVLMAITLIEGADMQLLPASFRAMEAQLKLSPSALAVLAMCQGVALAAAGPVWANLADGGLPRKHLLITGVAGWGTVTLLLACVSSFYSMVILRILNGIALGMLSPVVQSLVADGVGKAELGLSFGYLEASRGAGMMIATICVTTVSNLFVWTVAGWRFAFVTVGALSLLLLLPIEWRFEDAPRQRQHDRHFSLKRELRKFLFYFQIRSFVVIVAQGMFGTIPRAAMSFMTMYLQYSGLSDVNAALVYACLVLGSAIGAPIGGAVGDSLARWSPNHGRPLAAQISVLSGVPLVFSLFMVLQQDPPDVLHFAYTCFALGLMSSWCASACNRPLFAQIVRPEYRASAFAWEIALETASGQLVGPAAVGLLSEYLFGYRLSEDQVSKMAPGVRAANARALGHALAMSTALPWFICFCLYGLLHFTAADDMAGERADLTEEEEALLSSKPQDYKGAAVPLESLHGPHY